MQIELVLRSEFPYFDMDTLAEKLEDGGYLTQIGDSNRWIRVSSPNEERISLLRAFLSEIEGLETFFELEEIPETPLAP